MRWFTLNLSHFDFHFLVDGCTDEYCLSCKEGWFRVNYNRKRCQRKCPKGFYIYGRKRKLCLSKCYIRVKRYKAKEVMPASSLLEIKN